MVETGDIAEDSTVYYGMAQQSGLTWQTGFVDDLTNQFAANGALSDTKDTRFRPITKLAVVFFWLWLSFLIPITAIIPLSDSPSI